MISKFIRYAYDRNLGGTIYNGGLAVAFLMQALFLIWYRKKYNLPFLKTLLIILTVHPIAYLMVMVLTWIENGFVNWGAMNIVRVYVYLPLICMLVSRLVKVETSRMLEFISPGVALHQGIAHIVCPFTGCCYGYPCSWGIWNPLTKEILFPNQWLESIAALSVFLYLYRYAKKAHFDVTGKTFPLFLVLFGGTRFLLEFLRDNDKLFWGISNLALHAAFMVFVGGLWLYYIYLKEDTARRKAASKNTAKKKSRN